MSPFSSTVGSWAAWLAASAPSVTTASTWPSWRRTRQSSWLGTTVLMSAEAIPAFFAALSAVSCSSAVEPSAEQIRLPASVLSYPLIVELLGARTCWPVRK